MLGIPHPAVNTRDVGLYQPFRNSLQITQLAGLATLTWRLMRRRIQDNGLICPVSRLYPASKPLSDAPAARERGGRAGVRVWPTMDAQAAQGVRM